MMDWLQTFKICPKVSQTFRNRLKSGETLNDKMFISALKSKRFRIKTRSFQISAYLRLWWQRSRRIQLTDECRLKLEDLITQPGGQGTDFRHSVNLSSIRYVCTDGIRWRHPLQCTDSTSLSEFSDIKTIFKPKKTNRTWGRETVKGNAAQIWAVWTRASKTVVPNLGSLPPQG